MKKRELDLPDNETGIRLNKYLSDAGFCSRRQADKLVEEKKVIIDGEVASLGTRVFPGQKVICDGKEVNISLNDELILIALNKPRGIECTSNLSVKNNIIEFVNYPKRIYPIGRLDKDSQGLILLTNDGSLVNRILKGSNDHEKEYEVIVDKPISDEFIRQMEKGVEILDTVTKPCKIQRISKCKFKIIITQGLNRQIRRMCEALGYKVRELKRIRIMNIHLGNLKIGSYRNVSNAEYKELLEQIKESHS